MDWVYSVKIPISTPEDDPVKECVRLPAGLLQRVDVLFPPGCAGLVHVQVWYEGSQFLPTTRGESYYGDNMYREIPLLVDLEHDWNEFEIVAWNNDDWYEHTVVVYFVVVKEYTPGWVKTLFGDVG